MDPRVLTPVVREDLNEQWSFSRAHGKSEKRRWLARYSSLKGAGRINWDNRRDRKIVLESSWPPPPALVVLDEFHKYRFWKRWLKGEYDVHREAYRFS